AQGVRPHFIGALQTNKAKYVVGKAELIQSVDRLALAEEINRLAQKAGLVQPVLIEINIGGEEQKSGILPGELPELLKLVSDMRNLSVKGLMCVPPAGNEDETRYFFAKMRELFLAAGEFSFPNFAAEQLSMGMSGDYKAAVAEGATMLRIGSAIFGARDYGRVRV
ncbi:MAG: YggS family pyridoxal phosphate-dependent enzyme, partial [Eubacteriales bacterium]|nr:YggS family pyridoxal phosphate-dependent enzyme [Eubacteriales bacterium]